MNVNVNVNVFNPLIVPYSSRSAFADLLHICCNILNCNVDPIRRRILSFSHIINNNNNNIFISFQRRHYRKPWCMYYSIRVLIIVRRRV